MTVSASRHGGQLWAVPKNVFHHIAVQAHMRAMHDIKKMMRRIPLFRENNLTSEDIESLAELVEIHKLTRGYVLCEKGYDLDFFLLVRKGTVELSRTSSTSTTTATDATISDGIEEKEEEETMSLKHGQCVGLGCLLPPNNDVDSGVTLDAGYERLTSIAISSNSATCILLSKSDFTRVVGACSKLKN